MKISNSIYILVCGSAALGGSFLYGDFSAEGVQIAGSVGKVTSLIGLLFGIERVFRVGRIWAVIRVFVAGAGLGVLLEFLGVVNVGSFVGYGVCIILYGMLTFIREGRPKSVNL